MKSLAGKGGDRTSGREVEERVAGGLEVHGETRGCWLVLLPLLMRRLQRNLASGNATALMQHRKRRGETERQAHRQADR